MDSVSENSVVVTPCRLVYIKSNKSIEIKPELELDFDKLFQLWGIECGGVYISCQNGLYADWDNIPFGNWEKALTIANDETKKCLEGNLRGKWEFRLPTVDELGSCFFEKRKFNETVEIIQENTPSEPDKWLDGWYWSKDEFGCNSVHTFDMKDGIYSTHDRRDSNGFIRLALAPCE